MFDIKKVEEEARAEINEEMGKAAKSKIKNKLREIAVAERVVQNLRGEYDVLLRDIGSEVVGG